MSTSKLDLDYYENIILFNALISQEYLATIIEYIDYNYFVDKNISTVFRVAAEFFSERGAVPNYTEIKSRLITAEDKKAFNEVAAKLKNIDNNFNREELIANTEHFLKERCLYKTIVETSEQFSKGKADTEEILKNFEKAYNINLTEDLGHWYFEEIDEHIRGLTVSCNPMATGWKFLDDRIEGGLFPKSLYCLVGQVNVGKSIFLGNIATNFALKNKNVLLISLEMSEHMYAKRISSQISQIPHGDLKVFSVELKEQVEHIKKQLDSKLIIKEYPPKTITVRQIDGFISKLQHQGFKPDVVVIDYVNLIKPTTKNVNSYESVKEVCEQLRALTFKYGIPFVTASQLNRCLSLDAKVVTKSGSIEIKDLKVGDTIRGKDEWVEVRHIYPVEKSKTYTITTESGKKVRVSSAHLFPTSNGFKSIDSGLSNGDSLYSLNDPPGEQI